MDQEYATNRDEFKDQAYLPLNIAKVRPGYKISYYQWHDLRLFERTFFQYIKQEPNMPDLNFILFMVNYIKDC